LRASTGVRDGKPALADGTTLDVTGIVWCTGYSFGASWIEPRVFDDHGEPIQSRGVARDEPGLYFVGNEFLYSPSSAMVHWRRSRRAARRRDDPAEDEQRARALT
jgi:putative flavoprotein involved in K+ transport